MSYTLDAEYINKISHRLENFKWKTSSLSNCKCPLCGEGSSKKKKRGYFYVRGDKFNYQCHNCSASMSFQNFLKDFDAEEYRQYIIEKLKESGTYKPKAFKSVPIPCQTVSTFGTKYGMIHVSQLEYDHPARVYTRNRKIPTNDVYYTEKFFSWGSQQFPEKFKETILDHPRLIFPAYDAFRNIIGYSCRSINGEEPKYYTLKMVDDFVFGLNRIDQTKPVYVVEGGIDSLFIQNCVAACTSALHTVRGLGADCERILVPDNQPRNAEIVKLIGKFIDLGHKVVIWPATITGKDINDLILDGYSQTMIMEIINNNTYQGPVAKVKYNQWRKV